MRLRQTTKLMRHAHTVERRAMDKKRFVRFQMINTFNEIHVVSKQYALRNTHIHCYLSR